MVRTFTLLYLVDNINLPSEMILHAAFDKIPEDELSFALLNLLEVDPGYDLVSKVMDKI